MKIIFLDCDGVINNWKTLGLYTHDPRCIRHLNYITDMTGAKLVISSVWRKGRSLEELKTLFKNKGIRGEIIGKTPANGTIRGLEIQEWILGNLTNSDKFVILDDDSDMGELLPYLLQTNPKHGLTKRTARLAVKNLMGV